MSASTIHYATEVFSNPTDGWFNTTNATAGLYSGVFRFITGRPGYSGSPTYPVYGTNEISVDGASIGGNNVVYAWKEGIIQKDGFTENPAREIDIVACGQYATDSSFAFKIRGDFFVTDTTQKSFWKYCADNTVEFTGRRVIMWIVIDGVFYQCGRGRIVNNPIAETDYEFDVQDDSKLIHKMLPPLVTNPTNNPDISDSDQGQSIPVVIGDVPNSKILKLATENTFIPLVNYLNTIYTTAAATTYTVGTDTIIGPWKLNLVTNGIGFVIHELKGYYLSIAFGDNNINADAIYKIDDNDATLQYVLGSNNSTMIYLSSPLLKDSDTLLSAFAGNPNGINFVGSGSVWTPITVAGSTFYFRISKFAVQTQISNLDIKGLVYGVNGAPQIYEFNTSLKEYVNVSQIAKINPAGNEINLVANSTTVNGQTQIFQLLGLKIFRYGLMVVNYGSPGYTIKTDPQTILEDYTSPSDLSLISDLDRATYKAFSSHLVSNTVAGVKGVYILFADFTPNRVSLPSDSNVYFCVDFDAVSRTSGCKFQVFTLQWITYDIYGNEYRDPNAETVYSDIMFLPPDDPNVNHVNTTPNDSLKNLGFDSSNILGIKAKSDGSAFKKILKISDTSIFINPQIAKIRMRLEILITGVAPTDYMMLDVKEMSLILESKIDTLTGDLYTKVKGELTGPQTTDPLHETNDVYHAFMHIMEDYDGIPKGLIDYGNLPTTRGARQWHVGRTLTDRKNSIDYLNELCSHSFVGMFGTRTGKRGLRSFQNFDDFGTPVAVHNKGTIVRDSIESFDKTDIAQLFNSFFLQYNFDPGLQQYIRSFIVSKVDNLKDFPSVNDLGGATGLVPSTYATLIALISTNGFIYGNIFYTTNGSDTTDNALAGVKGSALAVGDSFLVTGGSSVTWEGLNTGIFPTWYEYFGGLIGDPSNSAINYADSKDIWDKCRASFVTNQSVKQAQNDISQLVWFIDTFLFNGGSDTWGHGTQSSAYLFLQLLAQWTTLQKYIVKYRIPIDPTTVETELLDVVTFSDVIYTADEIIPGIIIHVEPDPSTDQLVISTILKPSVVQGYNLIIERGPLLNTDTITEGDHQTDTITEIGV